MFRISIAAFLFAFVAWGAQAAPDSTRVATLTAELKAKGQDPVAFVVDALQRAEVVIFDEGLHSAKEPWDFFNRLVADKRFSARARNVFLEVLPYNVQRHLDTYLASPTLKPALLYPALQDSLDTGWPFQTYADFMSAVWTANQSLPKDQRIRVIGVGPPVHWPSIDSPEEFARYRRDGFAGYDHDMYARIKMHLKEFDGSERGVFLTNTRHAYNGIKKADGSFFWNAGTYFRQWHPGHSISLRINAPFLEVKAAGTEKGPTLGSMATGTVYGWTRADSGAWDAAFAANGDAAVAIAFDGSSFGQATYVGNHMLTAAPGQTMSDAYDGVIHLKRLEGWHKSGLNGDFYTPAFKRELARRLPIIYPGDQLQKRIKDEGVATTSALIEKIAAPAPAVPLPESQALPSLQ